MLLTASIGIDKKEIRSVFSNYLPFVNFNCN